MKIIVLPPGIGRTPQMEEMQPGVVIVPDSSLIKDDKPVFLPDLNHSYAVCPAFALRVCKVGKHISPRFSHRYVQEIAPAVWMLDISAIEKLNAGAFPWAWGCAFDGSVTIGKWNDFAAKDTNFAFAYSFSIGPQGKKPYAECEMSFFHNAPHWEEALAEVSRRFTLKMGDILIMGIASPLPVENNYHLHASQEDNILFDYNIK